MQILDLSNLSVPPTRWLVPSWLGRDTLTLMIGAGGASKSWAALDLGIALASGQPWLGQPTQPAKVLYVDEDGQIAETVRRLQRLCSGRAIEPPQLADKLWLAPAQGFKIDSPTLYHDLASTSTRLGVDLIVIDALVAIHDSDENDNKGMGFIMRGLLRTLMRDTGAGILLIHHEGKPSENRSGIFKARGATEIINSSDAAISCTSTKDSHLLTTLRSRVLGRPDWPAPLSYDIIDNDSVTHLAHARPDLPKIEACIQLLKALPELPTSVNRAVIALGNTFSRPTVARALACLKGGENGLSQA